MKKKKNLEAEEQNIENEEPELDGKSEIGGDSETDDDLDDGEDPESDDESDDSGDSGLDDDLDDSEDSELADNSEPGGTSEVEETPARQKRPYEDYVIEDPEDMDDAPDTGDMFDDEELYGDDDYFAEEKAKTRKGRRRSRHGGISGGVLALLWAVFLILVGVYVYVFFINDKLFTEDITGRDNTVRLEIPDGANYRLCTIDEINQLVNNYLLARTKADQTTLQRLVTDPSEFDDMKSIEIAAEYITAYNKITCYIANGYTADSYIVYELSNLMIKDVNSEPLDIRSLYVTKQSDGSYKINNSALSDKESSYINTINSSGDIQAIYEHVKENNDYLLRTDETFRKFQNMYN